MPSFADAWNNLGTCLRELKRPEEAETVYRKALELGPNNPDTLDNLALALKDLDRLDEAAETDAPRARHRSAQRQAASCITPRSCSIRRRSTKPRPRRRARSRLTPNNHDAVNLMGRVAFERGELEASLAHYRRALALKPDLADAYNNMGNVLKELGKLDEAHAAYLQALRLDPNIAGVYVNLADSKKFAPGDPHLAAMEALAAKSTACRRPTGCSSISALGKAYADLKDHERSFRHLLAGNAAKRATVAYDEQATFALFDRIEAIVHA